MNKSERIDFLKSIVDVVSRVTAYDVACYIACQFALESNFGKSKIAKENCNLCGMKLARVRPTTAISESNKHAYYLDWYDSVVDYLMWLSYKRAPVDVLYDMNQFKFWLQNSGYCPSADYTRSIDLIYNQYMLNLKK